MEDERRLHVAGHSDPDSGSAWEVGGRREDKVSSQVVDFLWDLKLPFSLFAVLKTQGSVYN